ncbi:MAG: hypothetical protein J5877_05220 [Clostridia bacterium]|nr:hypothetical protein [Clostridia bacterium]
MALNYEKYSDEYDSIVNYYKPLIKKYFLIGLVLCIVDLIIIFAALYLLFNNDGSKGKVVIVLLILASVLTSIIGRLKAKRTEARREMNKELNQLELARKQASISD